MPGDAKGSVAVVLAAGLGTRLHPLTGLRPKALCPVGNKPLVDHALERVQSLCEAVAVNVHHGRDQMIRHLRGRAHLSIEESKPRGTAGALVLLRDWIAGRDVLIVNADAWHRQEVQILFDDWDRVRPRLLVVHDEHRADFKGGFRYTGAAALPYAAIDSLPDDAFGLYDALFAREALELVVSEMPFFDCGTPADYHAANMSWSGGENVIGEGAIVEGHIERTVVWPGARVAPEESLADAIRADGLTVYALPRPVPDDRKPAAPDE